MKGKKRAGRKRYIDSVSYWGNSTIYHIKDSEDIAIVTKDGKLICRETNEKGRGNRVKSAQFEQAELFSTDHYRGVPQYADTNVPMSSHEREKSQS